MPVAVEEPSQTIPLDPDPVPAPAPAARPEEAEGGISLTAESIRELLLDLVPEAGQPVRWIDAAGRAYEAPPLLPARRQVLLGERARELLAIVQGAYRAAGGQKAPVAVLVAKLAEAASTELLDQIDHAFAVALPDQLAAARNGGTDRPTDLFPVEELLKAVLPFYARPLAELVGLGEGRIAVKLSR